MLGETGRQERVHAEPPFASGADVFDAAVTPVRPRRSAWWALLLLALAAAAWFFWRGRHPGEERKPPAAVSVVVGQASRRDVPMSLDLIGAAQAWKSAAVRAQVAGRLTDVVATEGRPVRQGQVLALLDSRPLEAAVMQAEGALERDRALLTNARVNLARSNQLVDRGFVTRSQIDSLNAIVKQYEGVVRLDQGAVNAARITLGYAAVRAPFDGRVGVRNVDPGNLVSPNDAAGILTVNQLSPIAVTFSIPQASFARVVAASGNFSRPLQVEAFSQDGGGALGTGQLEIADNRVDAGTGTVQLKARFANTGQTLLPGQLVNVRLGLGTIRDVLTVPSRAVNRGPSGSFVYAVRRGAAEMVPVTPGETVDGLAIVKGALHDREQVVVDGQLSLKPGMKVVVQPAAGAGA